MWSAIPRGRQTLASDVDGDGNIDLTAASEGREVTETAAGFGDGTFAADFVVHGDRLSAAFGQVASADADRASPGAELIYLAARSDNDAPRLARVTSLVAEGQGSGFTSRVTDYVGYPGPFALGDLDGDGQLDIVSAFSGSNAEPYDRTYVQTLFGNGDGTFHAHEVSAPLDGITTEFVNLADLEGDGVLEAVLAGQHGTRGVLLAVDLRGRSEALSVEMPYRIDEALTVDLNRDGRDELLVLDAARRMLTAVGYARERRVLESVSELLVADDRYTLTGSMVAADFDADGAIDLALAANATRSTQGYSFGPVAFIYYGKPAGGFGAPNVLQWAKSGSEFAAQVLAHDFDGDARVDLGLVTYDASPSGARVGILRNPDIVRKSTLR